MRCFLLVYQQQDCLSRTSIVRVESPKEPSRPNEGPGLRKGETREALDGPGESLKTYLLNEEGKVGERGERSSSLATVERSLSGHQGQIRKTLSRKD